MSLNYHKTYPAVIWGMRLSMNSERFDVPQAGFRNVSLPEAFSWAYAHFILEDEKPSLVLVSRKASWTRQVLQHALAA